MARAAHWRTTKSVERAAKSGGTSKGTAYPPPDLSHMKACIEDARDAGLVANTGPAEPDDYDEQELDRLKAHGIQLVHVMDEWNDRYGMFEYACHEGNYALQNIMSGARAQERPAGARR